MATLLPFLVWVVVWLAALIADVGYLYGVRSALQAAADLGALAGAQEVDLDQLAQGHLRLRDQEAEFQARAWAWRNLQAHPLTAPLASAVELQVRVVQDEGRFPVRHPWTGRRVRDPTVAVRIVAPVRPPWLGLPAGPLRLAVHAEASVGFRR